MPTNRKRRTRKNNTITDEERTWLYADCILFFHNDDEMLNLWKSNRDEVLAWWTQNKPGTRPLRWWEYDALKLPLPGSWNYKHFETAQRQQISGIGKPHYPHFKKGISESWDAIDMNNPPVFESEAAYLQRHNLLTPEEKKYLEEYPELLEPETVTFDD